MNLRTLLVKTLEAGIALLMEVGLGDELRDLKNRLLGKDEQSLRDHAFNEAYETALEALPEHELLDDRSFQEEVVESLLDPLHGFDVQAAAQTWLSRHPQHTLALRRFFSAFLMNIGGRF